MIEQLRTPPIQPTGTTQEQVIALRKYLYQTIQSLNAILLDIDRRLGEIEKGEKK